MARRGPGIKIANARHIHGVGGPDSKVGPFRTARRDGTRLELFVESVVGAFVKVPRVDRWRRGLSVIANLPCRWSEVHTSRRVVSVKGYTPRGHAPIGSDACSRGQHNGTHEISSLPSAPCLPKPETYNPVLHCLLITILERSKYTNKATKAVTPSTNSTRLCRCKKAAM